MARATTGSGFRNTRALDQRRRGLLHVGRLLKNGFTNPFDNLTRMESGIVAAMGRMGLPVSSFRDVLGLSIEQLEGAVAREHARTEQPAIDEKARRELAVAETTRALETARAEFVTYERETTPIKRAAAEKLLSAMAKADPTGAYFSRTVDTLREEAEANPYDGELCHAQRAADAAVAEAAKPLPMFAYPESNYLPGFYLPYALEVISIALKEKTKERNARIARVREDMQLIGAI